MARRLTIIGFGEARSGIGCAAGRGSAAAAFDIALHDPSRGAWLDAAFAGSGACGCAGALEALAGDPIVMTRATAHWQARLGQGAAPGSLAAKQTPAA